MGRETFRFHAVVSQTINQSRTHPYAQRTRTVPEDMPIGLSKKLGSQGSPYEVLSLDRNERMSYGILEKYAEI